MIVSLCSIVYLIYSIIQLAEGAEFNPLLFVGLVLTLVISSVCYNGLFTIEPNEAVVLVLFGKYNGTVSESGFWWVNPLNSKKKVSLRARNFDSDKLKVNDKKGNP
ncbi:MAG: SPFH domain-containing protein, partial [Candidatus Latescibacteria bacterium]|nr:SPFH domain-containing protein [Candidatus Latescibacterota bacterium]